MSSNLAGSTKEFAMKVVKEFTTTKLRDDWLMHNGFIDWDHDPDHPGWWGVVFVTNHAGDRLYVDGPVLYEDEKDEI